MISLTLKKTRMKCMFDIADNELNDVTTLEIQKTALKMENLTVTYEQNSSASEKFN